MQISTDALMENVAAAAGVHGVDASAVSGEEAARWLEILGRVGTANAALMAVFARRVEELTESSRFARAKGFAGAPSLVAQKAQMSTSEAGRLLELGRAMSDADASLGAEGLLVGGPAGEAPAPRALFEATSRAVAAGSFGSDKAAVIRSLLETLSEPTVELEARLVRLAPRLTLKELQGRCDRELAADHAALEARDRRQRAKRYLTFTRASDGMVGVHGLLDAVAAAPWLSWIEGQVRAQMGSERDLADGDLADGERRNEGQVRADVLTEMAHHMIGCDQTPTGLKSVMVVQVTKETVESGVGAAECHALSGPISWWAARQICVDAGVLPAVMGGASLPLDLRRAKRLYTPEQRAAIALRDKGCAKCGAPVNRCDVHHITFWGNNGRTDISNGLLLCVGCHHRLHEYGWGIEIDGDDVWFIPPASVDPHRQRIPASTTRSPAPTG